MSVKQRLMRRMAANDKVMDISKLNDDEFITYVIDTLSINKCVTLVNDFFWDYTANYGSGGADEDIFNAFNMRSKQFNDYTEEEWENRENTELLDIDTNEKVCDVTCLDPKDFYKAMLKRANVDNVTKALHACMNADKQLFEELVTDTIADTLGA